MRTQQLNDTPSAVEARQAHAPARGAAAAASTCRCPSHPQAPALGAFSPPPAARRGMARWAALRAPAAAQGSAPAQQQCQRKACALQLSTAQRALRAETSSAGEPYVLRLACRAASSPASAPRFIGRRPVPAPSPAPRSLLSRPPRASSGRTPRRAAGRRRGLASASAAPPQRPVVSALVHVSARGRT